MARLLILLAMLALTISPARADTTVHFGDRIIMVGTVRAVQPDVVRLAVGGDTVVVPVAMSSFDVDGRPLEVVDLRTGQRVTEVNVEEKDDRREDKPDHRGDGGGNDNRGQGGGKGKDKR